MKQDCYDQDEDSLKKFNKFIKSKANVLDSQMDKDDEDLDVIETFKDANVVEGDSSDQN